ncbi:zinc finger protein-domain-containing protein [Boeremia exigua]|uniref:zinc finger protein-domain-containing protein n=1 Tax=Boeremia exigua TaxID=749465 RepID=UPI001E8E74BF|nr:zinc finger protein-domain-containing protein [Boeremia exigua]KAH6614821.1 zinc finger protein-domain-containing protein [Boeremia exigua]
MADRRKEARTDDSTTSLTDSLRSLIIDNWNAGLHLLTNSDLEKAKPEYILSRMLSTKSAISTDSSLAEMNQRAQEDASMQTFASIGAGQTGTVYALKGTTLVIKLPNSPDRSNSVFDDFKSHKAAYQAFQGVSAILRVHVHVPALKTWVTPTSSHFWRNNAGLFPQGVQTPDYGLVSERIYPLPAPVRSALVDTFAPKAVKERKHDFLRTPSNKDCLIRIYLGRRNSDKSSTPADKFHLRNFPLHVNEMEYLKLDTSYYAKLMAQALAILHWRAGLDANDVEFVFGSSPEVTQLPTDNDLVGLDKDSAASLFMTDFHHRTVSVWLLDFNLCGTFSKDASGLKKLVDGFYWNDPYYPRPSAAGSGDQELWKVFAKHYVEVSAEFVQHTMPQAFIDAVEERGKKRSVNNLFG